MFIRYSLKGLGHLCVLNLKDQPRLLYIRWNIAQTWTTLHVILKLDIFFKLSAFFLFRFSIHILARQKEQNQRTKTDVHNYSTMSLALTYISFNFVLFGALVWKQKPLKIKKNRKNGNHLLPDVFFNHWKTNKRLKTIWKIVQNQGRNVLDIGVSKCF